MKCQKYCRWPLFGGVCKESSSALSLPLSVMYYPNFCMFGENGNVFSLSVADWLFQYIAHHTNTAHTSSSYGMAPIKNERNKKET